MIVDSSCSFLFDAVSVRRLSVSAAADECVTDDCHFRHPPDTATQQSVLDLTVLVSRLEPARCVAVTRGRATPNTYTFHSVSTGASSKFLAVRLPAGRQYD